MRPWDQRPADNSDRHTADGKEQFQLSKQQVWAPVRRWRSSPGRRKLHFIQEVEASSKVSRKDSSWCCFAWGCGRGLLLLRVEDDLTLAADGRPSSAVAHAPSLFVSSNVLHQASMCVHVSCQRLYWSLRGKVPSLIWSSSFFTLSSPACELQLSSQQSCSCMKPPAGNNNYNNNNNVSLF